MAAYPILVPVYLARYALPWAFGNIHIHAVIEAASKTDCIKYISNPLPQLLAEFDRAVGSDAAKDLFGSAPQYLIESDYLVWPQKAPQFARVSALTSWPKRSDELRPVLEHSASWQLHQKGILKYYQDFECNLRQPPGIASEVDFDDVRVREWSEEEATATHGYLYDRALLKSLDLRTQMGDIGAIKEHDALREVLRLSKSKPEWVLRWEQQQISSGSSTSGVQSQAS